MAKHHLITLQLKQDKAENVYRYIERWEAHQSSHGDAIYYLFVAGIFQWGRKKETPVKGFSIAMQYSARIGENVDVSQPAHVHEADAVKISDAFAAFVSRGAR